MLLLHISDIHFSDPICHTQMDPDLPYRTALVQDVERKMTELGRVEVILVTGDIAFHGLASEYKAAFSWLMELSRACGCPAENIFVVPGNHDVDRDVILKKANVRNAHHAVLHLPTDAKGREQEFLRQLYDPEVKKVLLEPVQAYDEFAARFGCQLYLPEQLFWTKDFPLDSCFVLKIYGLTSTLFSGAGSPDKEDDKPNSLYMSPFQTVFNPANGLIALSMCHHPPDWFIDHEPVDEAFRDRVTIQLFGHRHRQRAVKDEKYVRFSAGAVNPNRYEPAWEPGYNLIGLAVELEEGHYFLRVESHVMVWQTNPGLFRRKEYPGGKDVFQHRILLPGQPPAPLRKSKPAGHIERVADFEEYDGVVRPPLGTEADVSDSRTRNLVFRFWQLSSSQRREISSRLGLIDEDDMKLLEPERYGRAFQRAKERGLVQRLSDEIDGMERR